MKPIYIESAGLVTEGIVGFKENLSVLQGATFTRSPLEKYKPQVLPPNERRRATSLVRLSFQACEDALTESLFDPSELATVFSSSGGDFHILDTICTTIANNDRMISPTYFHNSVHNSAAGYWMIGAKSKHNSTSLSAFDHSFGAGLLEAATMIHCDGQPVLFAIYDAEPPKLIQEKRPITLPFAAAFILTCKPTQKSLASIQCKVSQEGKLTRPTHPELAALFDQNPAARSLPLLESLAAEKTAEITTSLPQNNFLTIMLDPC